jgi:putative transposase
VLGFVAWYNEEHRHSALKYVTPAQRHRGDDRQLHARRVELYEAARRHRPERWSGPCRNWQLADAVYLNPERDSTIRQAA